MKTIIFLGDSLTAGYGLPIGQSYPALFASKIRSLGIPMKVYNAGRNGDTTTDGMRRMTGLLREAPTFMVIALGANDMLQGINVAEMEQNLSQMISETQKSGSKAILFGMKAAPFHGPRYMARFNQVFPDLAKRFSIPLLPFLIQGVALRPSLNQLDGIHPNLQGQRIIAQSVTQFLLPIVQLEMSS